MDTREGKKAKGLFLIKSHVQSYTRRSKSGAVSQVSDYESARQAAEAASKKADDFQAKQNWSKPDTKTGAKLHAEAGLQHVRAMHEAHKAGNSEAMKGHYYRASHHLGSADHHMTFKPGERKARAAQNEKIAGALSNVANTYKTEHNHKSLDYGSSIHLLAAEQHNMASRSHFNADDHEKGAKHRDAAVAHGKKVVEISSIASNATEHAWNASDRARIGGHKPEHHMDAARAHRKAAELNYDSEGRAQHENAAAEHEAMAALGGYGKAYETAKAASEKANKTGKAEDHLAAKDAHFNASKVATSTLEKQNRNADAWKHDAKARLATNGSGLKKSHVKGYARRSKSGATSYVSEYERDAIAEGRKPSIGEFLHGREYDYDGIHGHWKHIPAKVHKKHPLYGENWKEPEKLEHVPSAKGKQGETYQAIRQKLGDDFISEPSDDRIVDAAIAAGYDKKYPADGKGKTVQGLIDGIEKVSGIMLKNPALKEHYAAITRKVAALKANPTAKAAHQVADDLKLIIESSQKTVKKSYSEQLMDLAKSYRR